ncbi:hypothetical protein [Hymenobacter cellulosilyticus]|uniref:DUF1624 domain-containing protein n=1 Tax=Hymenobacter cellulosilyticus TaxID=2932248 RepID=A0A8T9Q139_9BACT|nr:hypothetical protein [Hymenobacter cellulosilyticus]UOQ70121.1 hypothetical protein MUN79_15240 [Hymenobacter cellulosilyticus]
MSEVSALPPVSATVARPARVQSIDLVRGLVMVIMALDHVREFWSPTPVRPEDVSQASALLFLTRWVTHFCAPRLCSWPGSASFSPSKKSPAARPSAGFC